METLLIRGLDALSLTLTEYQQQQLLDFVAQLAKWNNVYNFTAITDHEDMVVKHLLDSLAVAAMIKSGNVADVGTGPGLPGIPLAIVKPEVQFTLIDTNAKRVRFLHQLIHALGLKNAQAVHTRIEKHHPQPGYDQIISRAFSQIKPMVELTLHALADNGELLAMKGVFPEQEMGELTNMEVAITQIQPIKVPFLDAERHLVVLKKRNISD